ncbi:MAG: hypothetical protein ACWA41_11010 [Putridiphycobacter sp.]
MFSPPRNKKLQSSAMYYAMFLLTMVSIIIAGLFQFSLLNNKLETQLEIERILTNNAKSGIAYGQAYFLELEPRKKNFIRLYDEGIDSVILTKKNWGGYQIIESKAIHHNLIKTKIALVGSKSPTDLPTLFLADQGRPLSLCGKTKIKGTVEIPQSGVKRAYIAGESYQGDKLIYGTQTNSSKQLPQINIEVVEKINSIDEAYINWDSDLAYLDSPFDSLPTYFYSKQPIFIKNQSLKGQILIESTDSIVVMGTADLNNVILKSPTIIIENNFRGSIQCIASEKIELKENVILEYPSLLGVNEQISSENDSKIIIGENSQIVGTVFLISQVPNFRKPLQLQILENSVVNGLVYCDGQTELKGKVNGSIYTQSFNLNTASSSYQNYLLNAEIINELPEDFIPAPILEMSNHIKIIQWLN